MTGTPTRRQLIGRSLALAAGAGVAGAALRAGPAAAASVPQVSDLEAIRNALEVEQLMAFAYEHVLGSPAWPAVLAPVLRNQLAHEREHIAALSSALSALGAQPPAAPASAAAVDGLLNARQVADRLTDLHTKNDSLKLLIDLESLVEGAHYAVAEYVRDSRLARLCSEIMACEAQHWTVLSFLRHSADLERAVPYAFVFGYGDVLPGSRASAS